MKRHFYCDFLYNSRKCSFSYQNYPIRIKCVHWTFSKSYNAILLTSLCELKSLASDVTYVYFYISHALC